MTQTNFGPLLTEVLLTEKPAVPKCYNGFNPFVPTVAFNICCPRDCVSRHNGGTSGALLKPLRDDSALRALSSPRGLKGGTRGSPIMPRDAVSRTAHVGT